MSLYPVFPFQQADHHRIIELMRNDKKNVDDAFRFTLLTGIGVCRVDVESTPHRWRKPWNIIAC